MDILTQVQGLLKGSEFTAKMAGDETHQIVLIIEPNKSKEGKGFVRGAVFQDKVLLPGHIVVDVHGKLSSDHGRYFLPAQAENLETFIGEHYLNIVPEVKHSMVDGSCDRCGAILQHVYPCIGCEQQEEVVTQVAVEPCEPCDAV